MGIVAPGLWALAGHAQGGSMVARRMNVKVEPVKILLIDHETYRIQSLSRGLRIVGHQVFEAKTLQQALACIRHEAFHPDLIVTDCSTRILCNPEMIQTVQERLPGIQVVATRDFRPERRVLDSLPWPIHYLDKPFTDVELLRLVETAGPEAKTY